MQKPSPAHSPPQPSDWTIIKLLGWTSAYFSKRDIDSPRATAEILLAHTLGVERIRLYLDYDKPLTADELAVFKTYIQRRAKREPVAYITSQKEFWTLSLKVTPQVLIPRPDTECLVENTLPLLKKGKSTAPKQILELGVGSGAITLALAKERPDNRYYANDCSATALQLARQNALHHRLDAHVRFFGGNWFDPLRQGGAQYDVIVSNPPYIPSSTIEGLQPEVSRFEPRNALDGGPDGLDSIRHIIRTGIRFLKSGGSLALEMGFDQKAAISRFVDRLGGYSQVEFFRDYGGRDRVVRLRK